MALFSPLRTVLGLAVLAGLVITLAGETSTPASAQTKPEQLWHETEDPITDILQIQANGDWGRRDVGKASDQRVEELVDEVIGILSDTKAEGDRDALRQIQAEIRKDRSEIERTKFSMATAPEDGEGVVASIQKLFAGLGIGKPTKGVYRERMDALAGKISELEAKAKSVKERFAGNLERLGIRLDTQQVDGLLSMATTDDLVDLLGVFENLKSINKVLLKATEDSRESIEVAKRYYGVYSVMLELAVHLHDKFLDKVDKQYLARLGDIEKRTQATRTETLNMAARERGSDFEKVLEGNLKSLDLTLKVAGVYRTYLARQKGMVETSRRRIARQLAVAINTYRTVKISADLIGMMRTSGNAFEALMHMDIPTLRPFESIEMRQEFNRLTEQLKGAPTS